MNENFFHDLPAFSQFEKFTRTDNYQPLPNDWLVVVADIRDSTRAISEGKYKEVNLIGAASITQTMLVLSTQEVPFVFGGDGASICIPLRESASVSRQLSRLATLARDNFSLELRVAMIPVADIRELGSDVLVSKLEITRGKYIALFRGGGLAAADKLAKQASGHYRVVNTSDSLDSLTGLSCRWSPVPSRKGHIVSLLAMARNTDAMDIYGELVMQFREILGRDISDANPVQSNLANYRTVGEAIREEGKHYRNRFSLAFLRRLVDILLSVLIFRHGINPVAPVFNAREYKDSVSEHSDFRKFDDTLRLIMDCTDQEYKRLEALLEEGRRLGKIYYGLFASPEALMTCFVESTRQGEHLHFIDGGDGGLAMASRQLKQQMGEDKS